jgi:hypothetical protein
MVLSPAIKIRYTDRSTFVDLLNVLVYSGIGDGEGWRAPVADSCGRLRGVPGLPVAPFGLVRYQVTRITLR